MIFVQLNFDGKILLRSAACVFIFQRKILLVTEKKSVSFYKVQIG